MKPLSKAQHQLLTLLSDGHNHTGTALGSILKISRTAIWKQIHQLIELGLPISRTPQKGYCLNKPIILLDKLAINKALQSIKLSKPVDLHILTSIDSTNRFLKELPSSHAIDVCCAEMQTQGRGRFGRSWYSPFGENIYCSTRWHINGCLSKLSGLSLVVSLAVLAAIKDVISDATIHIKWPNDLLWQGRKICGILIDIVAESHGAADVIIGIGINTNSQTADQTLFNKPWCSLFDITGRLVDRNQVIARLIIHLDQHVKYFLEEGFAAFIPRWQQHDYLHNRYIDVSQGTNLISGTAQGVNELGQLILIDETGTRHDLSSGDTSLQC